jgi:hypothetical protein
MVQEKMIKGNPDEVALFLFNGEHLQPAKIGEYLSDPYALRVDSSSRPSSRLTALWLWLHLCFCLCL